MRILVTGSAGFIGFHLAGLLLDQGEDVWGVDNFSPYYDVGLKRARLSILARRPNFRFTELDLADAEALSRVFGDGGFEAVVNLAAQPGVRYSLKNPEAYIQANLVGFGHLLEACRRHRIGHLVFASSSSVYGANTKTPFSVHDNVDHPVSLYAATKKSNELMAHAYSHLFDLPCTGLRFFTVYGPWGRPDMAYFMFTKAILEGRPIEVFNQGRMERDFTYVDDIVAATARILRRPPRPDPAWSGQKPDPGSSYKPFRVYNIGNNRPEPLMRLIEILEEHLGRKAEKIFKPLQPGDVPVTWADVDELVRDFNYRPATTLEQGLRKFVDWYREYHGVTA